MIIVDFGQVMYSTLMLELGFDSNKITELNEDKLRHMIINCIRSYNVKYKQEYGELVIACDSSSWRKDVFPYYKANRKKARDESQHDWAQIYETINKIRAEIKQFLPYRTIIVEKAEADDIISVLIRKVAEDENSHLILSGDKDFVQLHKFNVKQYDPCRSKWVSHPNPSEYCLEHIIRGDSGDGIPNILSNDNCLVVGERQKPITQKRLDEIKKNIHKEKNWHRNRILIDLHMIPEEIEAAILSEYASQAGKNRSQLLSYFMDKKLKMLTERITEF